MIALANADVAVTFVVLMVLVGALCERLMRSDAVTEVRDHPDNRARRALGGGR